MSFIEKDDNNNIRSINVNSSVIIYTKYIIIVRSHKNTPRRVTDRDLIRKLLNFNRLETNEFAEARFGEELPARLVLLALRGGAHF